jgi:hypothetical protein
MAEYLQGPQVNRLSIVLGIIVVVAVLLRVVARSKSKASFAIDDYWISVSLVPFFGMIASSTFCRCLYIQTSSILD